MNELFPVRLRQASGARSLKTVAIKPPNLPYDGARTFLAMAIRQEIINSKTERVTKDRNKDKKKEGRYFVGFPHQNTATAHPDTAITL